MELPEKCILERRKVKYWRIRITRDGVTRVVVPRRFSDADIDDLFREKKDWIKSKLREIRLNTTNIELESDQILFLGKPYRYLYDEKRGRKVIVDHELRIVRAKKNLLDPDIQEKWQRSKARKWFAERTEELARLHGFSYNNIYIRDQRTRWGSCSGQKNLNFNWRLIKAPEFVLDYIILHELLHTVIPSHPKEFHSELDFICPMRRQAVEWLNKYGHNL